MPPPHLGGPAKLAPAAIAKDRVRIHNLGNKTLALSYWDAISAWQTVLIPAGQDLDVICASCGATINLAFHNGKENKTIRASSGNLYALSWSGQTAEWELTGPLVSNVAQ